VKAGECMKLQLGVLFGGASVEHEISILSAMQAMDHLDANRYDIIPLYVAKDHQIYQSDLCRDINNFKDLDALTSKLSPVSLCAKGNKVVIQFISRFFHKEKELDLILPIMHGTYGEDGSVQGYLRMLGIPFCGSDLLGACIGQDKILMKQLLQCNNIPVVDWLSAESFECEDMVIEKAETTLGYPVIVKPATLGSSVGIHMVKDKTELKDALSDAFQYDRRVIMEHGLVRMKEYNCAVLGDEEGAIASSVEEVLKADDILSYKDKYEGKGKSKGMVSASRIIPAPLNETKQAEIEALALKTFAVLQGFGVARVDLMMEEDTGQLYVNEINTIPGSLSFYLFEPKGISFTKLLDELVHLALKRQRKQAQMIFSYSTNVLSSFSGGSKLTK